MDNQKSSISLNIIKLLSGRITAQILGFLTIPMLTRLFLPEHFGIFQIFDSILKVIIVISCLRYEMSIPLAQDDKEASIILVSSGLITLIFTVFVLGIVSVGKERVAAWFKVPEFHVFLWLLPVFVLAGGLRNVLRYWAAREGRFGVMVWSDLANSLTEKLSSIMWGVFIGASVSGLFVGSLIGVGVGIGVFLFFLRRKLFADLKNVEISFEMLWIVIKRYKKFPIFNTWTVFLNTISTQLPSLILGSHFSATVVGYYALVYRTINYPMSMLRDSISGVFFPIAAKEYRDLRSLSNVVSNFFTRLVQIGVLPMTVVSFMGPSLFSHIFGQQWTEAGVYAQMLAMWFFIAFINVPLTVFIILNRQELSLLMNILLLVVRTTSLLIGVTFALPRLTLGLFVITSTCCLIGILIYKLKFSQVSVSWALTTILKYIAISCILLFPVKAILWFIDDFPVLFGTLVLITGLYGIILFKIDHSLRQFILIGKWGENEQRSE